MCRQVCVVQSWQLIIKETSQKPQGDPLNTFETNLSQLLRWLSNISQGDSQTTLKLTLQQLAKWLSNNSQGDSQWLSKKLKSNSTTTLKVTDSLKALKVSLYLCFIYFKHNQ